ncbi:MAG: LapA family protein [Zetaproteobacteria bacterium]|nr:MAG: LapA family protein [Zetaproteobacteria bacterium]
MGSANWLNLAIVAVVAIAAGKFAADNKADVPLSIFGLVLDIPLYSVVFLTFLAGVVAGVLAMNISRKKHKREIARLREENARLREEVHNLRTLPLRDEP